jgi:hypothetical protein
MMKKSFDEELFLEEHFLWNDKFANNNIYRLWVRAMINGFRL